MGEPTPLASESRVRTGVRTPCRSASRQENDAPCGRCGPCKTNLLTKQQAARLDQQKWYVYPIPNGADLCFGAAPWTDMPEYMRPSKKKDGSLAPDPTFNASTEDKGAGHDG